jgi:hypothetical protein
MEGKGVFPAGRATRAHRQEEKRERGLWLNDGGRSSVGRAPDCDSGRRGFESHRSPHLYGGRSDVCRELPGKD